ncbi:hypothetical protein KO481_16470 [Nocardia sp. NEAU-G5]|uniref:Uncharacterized protein n=1 Tax=Nocardia albiluteola TaxID=2842303 RepID=A0ABS6B0Z5_9NOCA|nr:hypothetical protein [Nocardia albiluteola]MBU3063116.1 hypothetical protein [Nocardia albiluteola]
MKQIAAFEPLPPQVVDPIMHLAGQLISLSGYFAVAAIIVVAIRAWLRYHNGADALDLWRELLIILFLAAVAAKTFDIANWFH